MLRAKSLNRVCRERRTVHKKKKKFANELTLNSQNGHESTHSADVHVRAGAEAGLSDACMDDRRVISRLCDVCVCVNVCAYCKNEDRARPLDATSTSSTCEDVVPVGPTPPQPQGPASNLFFSQFFL